MRIRSTTRGPVPIDTPKPREKRGTSGITDPVPLKPVDKTRYSMTNRDRLAAERRKEEERFANGQMSESERKKYGGGNPYPRGTPRPKRSMKLASTYEAKPHTLWIREDIWAAVRQFKQDTGRSLRSIFEESLYVFLIRENRVKALDLGEDPTTASWVEPEDIKIDGN